MQESVTVELTHLQIEAAMTALMDYRGHSEFWAGKDKPTPALINGVIETLEKAAGGPQAGVHDG